MKRFSRIMLAAVSACLFACTDPYEDFEGDLGATLVQNGLSSSSTKVSSGGSGSFADGHAWYGANGTARIATGFDDGTGTSGYWYSYNDLGERGTSTLTWPVSLGSGIDSLDKVVESCGGLCFTITLGSGYEYPYAGVFFVVAGYDRIGADASSWGGLDLCYTSSYKIYLDIAPEDEETVTEYNNYRYTLPAASSETLVSIPWSSFAQQGGWGISVALEDVVSDLALVKFQATDFAVGTEYDYNITAIGPYGSITDCSGVVEEEESSSSVEEEEVEESSSSAEEEEVESVSFVWYGTSGSSRIETGFDDGTETSGYWWSYNDEQEGGTSTVTWPVAYSGSDIDSLDEVVEACGGLCFTVTLGSGYDYRNAGVAFYLVSSANEGADASGWGGLDVCYTGDAEIQLRLSTRSEAFLTEWDSYKVTLPAVSSETLVSLAWSDFAQEGWGIEVPMDTVYSNLSRVSFQVSELDVDVEYNFNITAVGSYGSIASCP